MEKNEKTCVEQITGTIDDMLRQIRAIIIEGSAKRLLIRKKSGDVLFQTPIAIGVAGATIGMVLAPIASALTLFVLFASDVEVLVEKRAAANEPDDEYEVSAEAITIQDDEPGDSG
ncbi:MAG: DUF4342 domain-containing protein [Balneolaceae bacterium]